MANPLDWTAGKIDEHAGDNPLGWAIGKGLRGINWAGGGLLRGSGSLLRGAVRGVGSLRDRMSRQDMGEDDSVSPERIPSDDGGLSNSGEILTRLINIENILRGMSQLATESNKLDAEAIENKEQAREEFDRLFEQQKDEPVISMSPTRVEDEEKKTGGLFGALAKFAGLIGPGSKLLLGIAGLTAAAVLAKKTWDYFNPDKSVTDAAGEVVSGAVRRFADEPGTPPGVVSGDTGPEALGGALVDPFNAGAGALERGVSPGVVGVQAAQQGINATRVGGMAVRAPFQVGGRALMAGGSAAWSSALSLINAVKSRSTAPRQAPLPGFEPAPTLRQRFGRWMNFGRTAAPGAARAAQTPSAVSRAMGLGKIGKFGMLGAILQGGTAVHDLSEGNYGQAATGTLATGLMFAPHPLAKFAGVALSLALSDYKTQDESKKNILGLLGVSGPLGMGGVGTGAISDTMGSWLYRGGSWLGSMMGGGDKEPEAAHGGAVGRRHILQRELEGAGYNSDQAQGIIKNMEEESGFDENAEGDYQTIRGERRPTAFGIAQWRGDRATNMETHVAAAGGSRFEGQVRFLIKELADYNLSPEQMPEDFAGAHNAVLQYYEKPAAVNVEKRWVKEGTPAPGREGAPTRTAARDFSSVGPTPAPVQTIARGRTATPTADTEGDGMLAPTAVVAPQTTNNFFDNRSTNILQPPLDARNREAGIVALQNLQGLTAAFG